MIALIVVIMILLIIVTRMRNCPKKIVVLKLKPLFCCNVISRQILFRYNLLWCKVNICRFSPSFPGQFFNVALLNLLYLDCFLFMSVW